MTKQANDNYLTRKFHVDEETLWDYLIAAYGKRQLVAMLKDGEKIVNKKNEIKKAQIAKAAMKKCNPSDINLSKAVALLGKWDYKNKRKNGYSYKWTASLPMINKIKKSGITAKTNEHHSSHGYTYPSIIVFVSNI